MHVPDHFLLGLIAFEGRQATRERPTRSLLTSPASLVTNFTTDINELFLS